MSPTTRLTYDANDLVNAKSHARENPILAGQLQHCAMAAVRFIGRIKKVVNTYVRATYQSVTIQTTPTKQHFPAPVFNMLNKVVLTLESVDEILKSVSFESKATKRHFPFILFPILHKVVVLVFKSVNEILMSQFRGRSLPSTFQLHLKKNLKQEAFI